MQLQSSAFAVGGRGVAFAAQVEPTAGQLCGTVLVGVYDAELIPLGVIWAIWLERAVKSGSLLTLFPLTETRPKIQLLAGKYYHELA